MTRDRSPPTQTSMFDVFEQAEAEARLAHLPETFESAIPVMRGIIERYHRAHLDGRMSDVEALQAQADDLAVRLNGGTRFGMKAGEDSPCDQLQRGAAAPEGCVPLWGQYGVFTLSVRGCQVRIEYQGLYGICGFQFSASAVEWDRPFLSDTGYRSFMLHGIDVSGGVPTVDVLIADLLEQHIDRELKGRLVAITQQYRPSREGPSP